MEDLALLDDDLLDDALGRLLRPCGGSPGDRLWNADAAVSPAE